VASAGSRFRLKGSLTHTDRATTKNSSSNNNSNSCLTSAASCATRAFQRKLSFLSTSRLTTSPLRGTKKMRHLQFRKRIRTMKILRPKWCIHQLLYKICLLFHLRYPVAIATKFSAGKRPSTPTLIMLMLR